MKTRRSKRLSKSPVRIDSDNEDSVIIAKKQKLRKKKNNNVFPEPEDETLSDIPVTRNSTNGHGDSKYHNGNESDSDSSTDFMQSPHALDLNSEFFKVDFKKLGPGPSSDFSSIEKKIFSDVQRLSDTGDSSPEEDSKPTPYYEIPIPKILQKNGSVDSPDNNLKYGVSDKKKRTVKDKVKTSLSKKKECPISVKVKSESIDSMNVSQLLAMGESQQKNDVKMLKNIKISDDEMSDWEEVQVDMGKEIKQEHSFPKEGVQITVDAPDVYQKRRNKGFDMEAYLKRRVNRVKREQQILVHKVHLLCWIGHGFHVNSVLNSEVLMGLSLSLIPSQHCYPNKVDITYLKKLVGWFIKSVPVVEKTIEKNTYIPLIDLLTQQFESGCANSNRDLVLMFICLLRSLGLAARLIISLQPVRLKPSNHELCDLKSSKKKKEESQPEGSKNMKKNEVYKHEGNKNNKKKEVNENDVNKNLEIYRSEKKMEKPKRKSSSKGTRRKVLSPEDARKSNKQVMSKEEAIVRLKSVSGDTKASDAKKPKLDSTKVTDKISNDNNTRRSVRPQRKSIKYKDVTSSSDDESENKGNASSSKEEGLDSMSSTKLLKKCIVDVSFREQKSVTASKKEKQNIKCKGNEILENQHISLEKSNNSESSSVPKRKEKSNVGDTKEEEISENICLTKERSGKVHMRGRRPMNKKNLTDDVMEKSNKKGKVPHKNLEKVKNTKCYSSSQTSEDEFIPHSQNSPSSSKKTTSEEKLAKKTSSRKSTSESDFELEITAKLKVSKKRNSRSSDMDRRVLSSDSEESEETDTKTKNDFWTEVLIDSEEWIPINVITGEVNGIEKLRKQATKPVTYIVGWNPDLTIKDVTRRYCKQFHSVTRKQRVEEKWWEETIFPFLSSNTTRDKKEDEDMRKQIQDQPLPTSIAEFKNHPLYVLKRHLLKFQAIYPPNAPTLGFVRSEAVYPRDCVYTLHSREIWLKEAKVVRLGEKPYKIVKARPKWDRMSGKVITDLPLEIFGIWQVEDYVPPTAVDGKVPRNAYGNVELFKPTMLPKGTVHLQVPGLNRVAKKLQIDCAPAVVGFDFHCGSSHPMYDGFVVCEEFQDTLLDAWNRDQEEAEKREIEKREKRIYGNWKKLIKMLLIREKLKVKYAFGEEENMASSSKSGKGKKKVVPKKSTTEDEDDSE